MKPTFATTATAMEPAVHPYDHYYASASAASSSSSSSSPSSAAARRDSSPDRHYGQHPRQHSSSSASSSSAYPSASSSSYTRHHLSDEQHYSQQQRASNYHHHHYQPQYQGPKASEDLHNHHRHTRHYPDAPSHIDPHSNNHHSSYPAPSQGAHHAYQQYTQTYQSSAQHVKHTEGYEGRIRNTTRDHNDHLVTDSSARDQQHHHDQFRRDPTYGFLKPRSTQAPYASTDDDLPAYKYHLPPIQVPEEPFYRSDLPGRHMRYFSNVTSQDRENSDGYFSSARHVAPSNTTGNFGHGPPINQTLERFESARQRQLQRQQELQLQEQHQQGLRLPSLYTALPEQRPSNNSPSLSQRHDPRQQQGQDNYSSHPQQPRALSPARSSVEYRSHQGHSAQQQQQQQQPSVQMNKGKNPIPRSIAPAPISPLHQKPAMSPTAPSFSHKSSTSVHSPDRHSVVKVEPKESENMASYQQPHYRAQRLVEQPIESQHQPSQGVRSEGKRKWIRDHSPVHMGPRLKTCIDPAMQQPIESVSQELHLLSRRSALPAQAQVRAPLAKTNSSQQPRTRMQRYQMTTIRCWHGAIAQKSYGIEKRYLCPPPMVQVSAGVNAKQIRAEQPHVIMSILHEKLNNHQNQNGSEHLMEQDCTLDDHLKCSFRNLHVTGTGSDSSKRFKLGLQVYLNKSTTLPTAIMDSNPIPIISKPSKKTAKAGNASCFILNGMSVSLLNRINAQTVRTKYMAVDNNAVCAKIGSWSSFTIKMVKPPPAPPVKLTSTNNLGVFRAPNHSTKFVPIRMKGESTQAASMIRSAEQVPGTSNMPPHHQQQHAQYHQQQQHPQQPHAPQHQQHSPYASSQQQEPSYVFSNSEPVLYGSEIILINDLTGVTTDRLVIRKVENGKVIRSGSGPVSQMQKIVLQHPDRVHPEDGRPYYLSASSIGSPKIEGKIPLQAAMDRSPLLEYRTSSKKASIMDLTEDVLEDGEDEYYGDENGYNVHGKQGGSSPRRVPKGQESVAVDDFVCWTIAGIAKFDYTYFGPIPASIDIEVDPRKVPRVLSHPRYNTQTNMLVMKVKNVFEKLSAVEEEVRLRSAYMDDPYDRKMTLSEFVYRRCEDVRQPMEDEEGPIQLWLAQHGPIRMRRRLVKDVMPDEAEKEDEIQDVGQQEEDEDDSEGEMDMEETASQQQQQQQIEDKLPKIPTKPNAAMGRQQQQLQYQPKPQPQQQKPTKRVKLLSRTMGLEAELPFGCEVRASHDEEGNAHAEMDILMVERATGIAYPTGYKVVYSRGHDGAEWVVEIMA
ncbi:hypothetical protein EDD11_002687 [Mortierella claussenii]|nr:hypothetical protein EDD11_002687 [Mortierella claussenii]